MPGPNDFLDYMRQQPGRGSPWGSGRQGPQDEGPSWSRYGGRYGGNIGGAIGGAMDNMYPMDSTFGIYRGLSAVNNKPMRFADYSANQASVARITMDSQKVNQTAIRARMESLGLKPKRAEDMDAVVEQMSKLESVQRLTGGSLSSNGAGALVSALANKGNRWRPQTQDVTSLHQAFAAHYGLDSGNVNLSRTMGRSQDELAQITSETRRRMDPIQMARARKSAQAELSAFTRDTVGSGLASSTGISASVWAEEVAKGGTNNDVADRVAARESKRLGKETSVLAKDMKDAAGAISKKNYGEGAVDTDRIMNKKLMEANDTTMKTLASFQAAGFTGEISELSETLEDTLGDESMDPEKMRALSDRMRAISDSTGAMFEEISNLTQALQRGANGVKLGANQSAGMAQFALMFGGNNGLTRDQKALAQAHAGAAISDASKSAGGIGLETMRTFDKGKYDQYQKLISEGKVGEATGLRQAYQIGAGTSGSRVEQEIHTMMAIGDMEGANALLRAQKDEDTRDVMELNKSKSDSSAPTVARRAELTKRLGNRVSFKDGVATGQGDGTFSNMGAGGAESREGLKKDLGAHFSEYAEAGAKLIKGGTKEQQEAAGALFSQFYANGTSPEAAMKLTRDALGQSEDMKGLINEDASYTDVAATLGNVHRGKTGQKDGGAAIGAREGMFGYSKVLSEKQFQAKQEREAKESRAEGLGTITNKMGNLFAMADQAGGAEALAAFGDSVKGNPALHALYTNVSGLKDDKRAEFLTKFSGVAQARADLLGAAEGTEDFAKKQEEYNKQSAALLGSEEGKRVFGQSDPKAGLDKVWAGSDDGSYVGLAGQVAKQNAGDAANTFKLSGELILKFVDQDGKVTERPATVAPGTEAQRGGAAK